MKTHEEQNETVIMTGLTDDATGLGKFGHHPDPAIDFCIEVEALEGALFDARGGISKPGTAPETVEAVVGRIRKAMEFRVGGDPGAVYAKHLLRGLEASLAPSATADAQNTEEAPFTSTAFTEARADAKRDTSSLRETVRMRAEQRAQTTQHSDDAAVDRFAAAMKLKLAQKRAEGRGGWDKPDECSPEFLSQLLHEHVAKGDPLDVGNFAMMLHQRGNWITPSATADAQNTGALEAELREHAERWSWCARGTMLTEAADAVAKARSLLNETREEEARLQKVAEIMDRAGMTGVRP